MADLDRFSLFTEARERLGHALVAGVSATLPESADALERAAEEASTIAGRRELFSTSAVLRIETGARAQRALSRLYDLTFRLLELNQSAASVVGEPPLLALLGDDELDQQILVDEVARAVRERLAGTYPTALRRVESLTRTPTDDGRAPLGAGVLAAAALEAWRPHATAPSSRGALRDAALARLVPRLADAMTEVDAWLASRGVEPARRPDESERAAAPDAGDTPVPAQAAGEADEGSGVARAAVPSAGETPPTADTTPAAASTRAAETIPSADTAPAPATPPATDTSPTADTQSTADTSPTADTQSTADTSPTPEAPGTAADGALPDHDESGRASGPLESPPPAATVPERAAAVLARSENPPPMADAGGPAGPFPEPPVPTPASIEGDGAVSAGTPGPAPLDAATPAPVEATAPEARTAIADVSMERAAEALVHATQVADVLGRQPFAVGRAESGYRHAGALPKPEALERDGVAFAHHVGVAPYTRPARQRYFDGLRDRMLASQAPPAQLAALDLVAALFDYVVDDTRMPAAAQPLLWRLQHPAVTLAALDAGFLGDDRRSMRRLVENLSAISVAYADDVTQGSELYRRLETVVRAVEVVAHAFQTRSSVLGEQVRREYERAAQGMSQLVSRVAKERTALESTPGRRNRRDYSRRPSREREQEVTRRLESELRERLARCEVPESVRDFLLGVWLRHLRTALLRDGEESAQFRLAIQVVDDLLWSLDTSGPRQSRRELAGRIPPLIRLLTQGVVDIGARPEEFRPFLDELFLIHLRKMQKVPRDGDTEARPTTRSGDGPPSLAAPAMPATAPAGTSAPPSAPASPSTPPSASVFASDTPHRLDPPTSTVPPVAEPDANADTAADTPTLDERLPEPDPRPAADDAAPVPPPPTHPLPLRPEAGAPAPGTSGADAAAPTAPPPHAASGAPNARAPVPDARPATDGPAARAAPGAPADRTPPVAPAAGSSTADPPSADPPSAEPPRSGLPRRPILPPGPPDDGRSGDQRLLSVLSTLDLGDFPASPQRLRLDPDEALERLRRGDWLELIGRDGLPQEVKVAWINSRRTVVLLVRRPDRRALSLRAAELHQRFAQHKAALIV